MRLGQVKRTHNIEISKITAFLKKKGFEISDHPNSKLTDEQLELVLAKLKPKEVVIVEEVKAPEEVMVETESEPAPIVETLKEEPKIGEVIEIKKEDPTKKAISSDDEEDENIEVIRAPKQKVEGLKVLGKIDLPEPKIEEKTEIEAEAEKADTVEVSNVVENVDPLAHLHPTKKAKVVAKEKLKEINSIALKVVEVKKKKKEKSIAEKVADKKKQARKKKKANPHKHIKKSGIQSQRIEISDDGVVLPKEVAAKKGSKEKELGFFAKIWKWFNT